jgi:phage tail-like protein
MARRDKDPVAGFRFALELDQVQVAGFAECSGLQMETKIFEYKEGGRNETTLKFPENTTYGNITLKRGITNSSELIDWHLDVVNGTFGVNKRSEHKNIAVVLRNDKGTEGDVVQRWNLIRAFPVKWVGPDLKATGNDVAIESLEIAHEGIQKR